MSAIKVSPADAGMDLTWDGILARRGRFAPEQNFHAAGTPSR
jgi:hypothetical protein